MVTYSTSDFKPGLKIIIDGDPYNIIESKFVKPGKGQAFTKLKVRNLRTGRVIERTFKSGESVDVADFVETQVQYLYSDGNEWHFMAPDTFEQYALNEDIVADAKQWLKGEEICMLTLWNSSPLTITPPSFVVLEIAETDPGLKGDTSSGGSKPATLETGAVVRVPLFVQIGEKIKVDTRIKEYVSRVKE